jgi:hypothetical protein
VSLYGSLLSPELNFHLACLKSENFFRPLFSSPYAFRFGQALSFHNDPKYPRGTCLARESFTASAECFLGLPTVHYSLPTSVIDFYPNSFHQLTNPYSRNPFVLSSIQIPGECRTSPAFSADCPLSTTQYPLSFQRMDSISGSRETCVAGMPLMEKRAPESSEKWKKREMW